MTGDPIPPDWIKAIIEGRRELETIMSSKKKHTTDDRCLVCGALRGDKHGEYQDTSGEWIPCEWEEEGIEEE